MTPSKRLRSAARTVCLLAGAIAVSACVGSSDSGGAAEAPADDSTPIAALESTTTLGWTATGDATAGLDAAMLVAPNPNNTLSAVVTITSGEPVAAQLTATSGDHVVAVPGTSAARSTQSIPLVGLRSDRTYELTAALTAESGEPAGSLTGSFTSGPIPERFADFEFSIDAERSSPGYTIIEMQTWRDPASIKPQTPFDDPQYLIALDADGEIIWYYENGFVIGGVEQTLSGDFTSTYFAEGVRAFDMLGNEIGDWRLPTGDGASVPAPQTDPADEDFVPGVDALDPVPVADPDLPLELVHHEAIRLPNGNLLTLSTTVHPLTPQQRETFCPGDPAPFDAISDVAVEFEPNGRVVRTWDLWDAVDIDEVPGDEMCNEFFAVDGNRDWTHANAVVFDEARDAVVISSRHTSQLIAMTRTDIEGPQTEVRWIVGTNGTMPLDGDVPRYPHAVEIQSDGSVLLYDNGNGRAGTAVNDPVNPMYSRAVLYAVDDTSADPADWTAAQTWEFRMDDIDGGALFSPIIGDADRLANGNVLITNGAIDFQDPTSFLHTQIIEVAPSGDSDGDVVWEFSAGAPSTFITTYRAERIESFYVGPDWLQPG